MREGGIVAFITSQGVLDAPTNAPIREYMMNHANLVGVARLPNNLFTDNAGTEVGGISAVVCRAVRHHPSYTCLSVTYIIYKGNNCNFNVKVRALWHPSN